MSTMAQRVAAADVVETLTELQRLIPRLGVDVQIDYAEDVTRLTPLEHNALETVLVLAQSMVKGAR